MSSVTARQQGVCEADLLTILERLKSTGVYWKVRQAVLTQIQHQHASVIKESTDVRRVVSLIEGLSEEHTSLVHAIKWLRKKQQKTSKREPPAILAVQLKWEVILKDAMNRQEGSIYSWKTLFSFLETLKEDKLIDLKINREGCINQLRQLLDSDQTGFPDDPVDLEKRSHERCRKALEVTGEEWKLADLISQACKKGLPNNYRSAMYSTYFRVTSINEDESYRQRLGKPISDSTDKEFERWVQNSIESVMEDEAYFLFKESLIAIIEAFVFDETTREGSQLQPIDLQSEQGHTLHNVPFRSFGCLVAPFFYCSTDDQTVYWLFRQMYSRHFAKLSALSADEQSIIYLSQLFEELFRRHLQELHVHLLQLGTSGLRLSFKWLFFAFVGFLDVREVFQLYDRMIGFASNQVLVLLALGIFMLKEEELLECGSLEQTEEVLDNLRDVNFIGTIRLFVAKIVDAR